MVKKNEEKILVESILDVLHQEKQDDLLPEVSQALSEISQKSQEEKQAVVWSVIPLSKKQLERMEKVLKVKLSNKIDKNLLAGFKIVLGDFVLDASLNSELQNLQRVLL